MNVIDIIIVLFILMGAIVGFKQGGIKRLTSFVGLVLIFIVSWAFKDKLSVFLYGNLPFFNFGGSFRGIQALNILFYELIAFLIIFCALLLIYRVLLVLTGVIEKLLKATIFLSIPSKILGIFVGALEAYVYIFIALVFFNLPFFNIQMIKDSKNANFVLNNSIFLSNLSENMLETYEDVYGIIHKKDDKTNTELNEEIIIIFLKNKVISVDNLENLIDKNKIEIDDKTILDEYR